MLIYLMFISFSLKYVNFVLKIKNKMQNDYLQKMSQIRNALQWSLLNLEGTTLFLVRIKLFFSSSRFKTIPNDMCYFYIYISST